MIVKSATLAAAVALLLASAASAASEAGAVKETIRQFFAKSNAGDDAGALALVAKDSFATDEFAPFHWNSLGDWDTAYVAYNKQNAITHPKTTLQKFLHVNVEGGHAYVVLTATYTYSEGGKSRKENGTEVVTLDKQDAGWRITTFSWLSKAGVDQGADATAVVAAVRSFAQLTTPPTPPPTAIVDEFAPYVWTGASANADWNAGLQKLLGKEGTTDLSLALADPEQLNVNGTKAYAVFPTVISSKVHGKPTKEHGAFAFVLDKADGAWHIASWTWATK
jgi:ketosteroid isomerase-like protein